MSMRLLFMLTPALGLLAACGDELEDVADPTKCGPAPHVELRAQVFLMGLSGSSTAAGAHFTGDICPTKDFVTDSGGRFTAGFSKDVPLILKGRFEGSFPVMSTEVKLSEDIELSGFFIPKALAGLLPEEFDDTSGLLVATTSVAPGSSGDCADKSGIALGIPGGTPVYFNGDSVPELDRTLRATTSNGVASAAGVPLGELIDISASKSGCKVAFSLFGQTGRARFEAGTITGGVMRISN